MEHLSAIAERCSVLEHLNLRGCCNVKCPVHTSPFAGIGGDFKNLTFLDVSYISSVTSLNEIVYNALGLRTLRAAKCNLQSQGLIDQYTFENPKHGVGILKYLEEIDVTRNYELELWQLFWILWPGRCVNLKRVRMEFIGGHMQDKNKYGCMAFLLGRRVFYSLRSCFCASLGFKFWNHF
jgi:hypothetical protein